MKVSLSILLFISSTKCFAQANDSISKMDFKLLLTNQDTISNKNKLSTKATDLKPAIVESKLLLFQKDSLENRKLYHKIIEDAKRKPKVLITPAGIGADGVFSRLAELISGKRKNNKKFLKTLEAQEKENFIRVVYNTERVRLVNNTNDSIADLLMTKFPMPYEYARTASPLEIDMWIRNNYRKFRNDTIAK